jgi:MFS transporter, PAT family, beta-lactamase induction signal transducer AmpG
MPQNKPASRNPWLWVPSLYFAEGIPYVFVMTVSVVLYKRMGVSNTDIALFTSLLYFPWVIKGLWGPFVDMFKTKRFWIVLNQSIIATLLLAVGLVIPTSAYFLLTVLLFALMAFSSATHDIAADGFYMLALEQGQQAAFVGVRSTFYRAATIFCQGGLVFLAGILELHMGIATAWSFTFAVAAAIFLGLFLYHRVMLPMPPSDRGSLQSGTQKVMTEFARTFVLFFKRRDIGVVLGFLLLYRFAEAQLVKMVAPFLLDPRSSGGLGLTTSEVGIVYGGVGVGALLLGGILGGVAISRKGLRWWLWPMVIIMHSPDVMFVYLSQAQPTSYVLITMAVAIEQFGYGFGFTAYMMYMIMTSEGQYKTAHYAICTAIMAFGMMVPGAWTGALQEWIGYKSFFLWVLLSTIPGFLVAALVRIPPDFGKKREA